MDAFIKLGLTLLIVALNGFFVAAEFAFVRVRQTRVAELVEGGNARAGAVQALLARLDTYLSATQLGVTIASLALGSIGEPAMAAVLLPIFRAAHLDRLGPAFHSLHLDKFTPNVHTLALVLGFIVITSFHIIFGELLPKWWVIAHTEETALGVAPIMRIFLKVGYPLIAVLEHSAKVIARRLKIEPNDEHEQAHSEDEILAIMAHSHREGALRPSEIELAENMFDFAHTMAREIMVPRVDMVCLSTTWTVGRNVEVAIENGFTRYPLCEGDRDHIMGMIHIKDLLAIAGDPKADISTVMRPIIGIPETKPIDELLKELQKSHTHQALVLDEYGGTAGLVTLEDIIEELIGEIQDEHDEPPPFVTLDEEGRRYSIAATVALEEVAERLKIPIENPEEYETIGGYALHKLRLAPRVGEQSNLDGFHVSISEVTGRRIKRLLFVLETPETILAQEAADAAAATEGVVYE